MKHVSLILTLKGRLIIRKKVLAFSMIEALLAGSLLVTVVFVLSGILIFGQESSKIAGDRQRATALAEEGLEIVRNMKEASFASLTSGLHGLAISGGKWQFSGVNDSTGIFTRSLIISDLDSYTKSVTSTVSWIANPQRTGLVSLESQLTNWHRAGTSDWSSTTVEAGFSADNNQNGVSVRVDGTYAYVCLLSASNNFLVVDISNPALPTLVGLASVTGNVTDMEISGNYVYLSSGSNNSEMTIVDVSNKAAPTIAGVYNASGNNDGLSIDVIGTTAYLARALSNTAGQNELYVINVSNPASLLLLGSYNAAYSIYDIQVSSDSYAYLATDADTTELVVLNVQNPISISVADTLNVVGGSTNLNGSAIAIFDSNADGIEDRAILARQSEGRVWRIDALNPTNVSLLLANGYTVTGVGANNINYLELFNANKYLAVATSAATAEVVIVDITTLLSPTVLSTTNLVGASNFAADGLAYAASVDRLLAVGVRFPGNSNYILEIIKPN